MLSGNILNLAVQKAETEWNIPAYIAFKTEKSLIQKSADIIAPVSSKINVKTTTATKNSPSIP